MCLPECLVGRTDRICTCSLRIFCTRLTPVLVHTFCTRLTPVLVHIFCTRLTPVLVHTLVMNTQLAQVVRTACLCITHLSHAFMYTQLVYYTPQLCNIQLTRVHKVHLYIAHLSHVLVSTQLVCYTPQWCTYSLLVCTKFTCLLHILVTYLCPHSLSVTHHSCVHTAYSCHTVHQCITHLSHVLTYTQLVYYTPQPCTSSLFMYTKFTFSQVLTYTQLVDHTPQSGTHVHTACGSHTLVMYSCTHSLCTIYVLRTLDTPAQPTPVHTAYLCIHCEVCWHCRAQEQAAARKSQALARQRSKHTSTLLPDGNVTFTKITCWMLGAVVSVAAYALITGMEWDLTFWTLR